MIKFLAVALLAAAATSAMATPPTSIAVSVADLDLSRAAGVATLDRRLKMAARRLCSHLEGRTLRDVQAAYNCRSDVLAQVQSSRDAQVAMARSNQLALLITK